MRLVVRMHRRQAAAEPPGDRQHGAATAELCQDLGKAVGKAVGTTGKTEKTWGKLEENGGKIGKNWENVRKMLEKWENMWRKCWNMWEIPHETWI